MRVRKYFTFLWLKYHFSLHSKSCNSRCGWENISLFYGWNITFLCTVNLDNSLFQLINLCDFIDKYDKAFLITHILRLQGFQPYSWMFFLMTISANRKSKNFPNGFLAAPPGCTGNWNFFLHIYILKWRRVFCKECRCAFFNIFVLHDSQQTSMAFFFNKVKCSQLYMCAYHKIHIRQYYLSGPPHRNLRKLLLIR